MMKLWKTLGAVLTAVVLTACGGGGGDGCGGSSGKSPLANCPTASATDTSTTTTSTAPVASDLTVVLDKVSVKNTGSETVTATITAVDASRNAVSGIPVNVSVDNNGVVIPGGTATNTSGQVTAAIGIGSDRTNRIIRVTVKSGSLTRTAAFQVIGATLAGTALPTIIDPLSAGNKIQFRLVDSNTQPIVGQAIRVSGPEVPTVDGTTGSNGEFDFIYTAPANSTPASRDITVSATSAGAATAVTVTVRSSTGAGAVPVVTEPIISASVTANPSVVSINAPGSTINKTQIRALFLGANNKPIKNVRVKFDLNGDANSIGGTFDNTITPLYSDANGVQTITYIPGSRSSPTDGLTIRACYGSTDADIAGAACPNSATTTLTVSAEPLSVSIGTDNTIGSGAGGLTYIKKYVVLVVNSSGQAMPDVAVTPSIDLLRYRKGFWGPRGQAATCPDGTVTDPCQFSLASQGPADPNSSDITGCRNEDVNRNGVLETQGGLGPAGTEDFNGNGQLDPRKSDVAISIDGTSNKTNSSGIVVIQIEYPENVATWIKYRILVSASGVTGTEGRAEYYGVLPASKDDFQNNPAFLVSPYGTAAVCSDKS